MVTADLLALRLVVLEVKALDVRELEDESAGLRTAEVRQ